jgi:hypothetical protein
MEQAEPLHRAEPYAVAIVHAAFGDADRTLTWLEKACEDTAPFLTLHVKCDPRLDVFRSDPRFVNLLRRMRLDR